MRNRKNELEAKIDRALIEAHGEVTEEIDQLFDELAALEPDVKGKIESLKWAHMKVKAQLKGSEAVEKFYKDEAKKAKVTTGAREKNIERIKDMVLLNLHTLEEREIRLSDGKKVWAQDFFKATVKDEEAAYANLKNTDIVERQSVLDSDGIDQVKDAVLSTLEAIQSPEGEPVHLDAGIHTKLMHALDVMKSAQDQYKFDGKRLNAEVKRLHEERKERLAPLQRKLAELSERKSRLIESFPKAEEPELDPEEFSGINDELNAVEAEIADVKEHIEKIEEEYSISGVTYKINESVRGL